MKTSFFKAVYQVAASTYKTVSLSFKAVDLAAAEKHAVAMAAAIGFAAPKLIHVGATKAPGAVGVFVDSGQW